MVDVRAYMLQRAKVPAKIHALDTLERSDAATSRASSPPRVILPRVINDGRALQAATASAMSRSSRERRRQRPFNEPVSPSHKSSKPVSRSKRDASSVNTAAHCERQRKKSDYGVRCNAKDDARSVRAETQHTRSMRSGARQSRNSLTTSRDGASVASERTPNYGRVPAYLQKMKNDKLRKKLIAEEKEKEIVPPQGFRQVSEEERRMSLACLKQQQDDLNAEIFRRAPFRSETMGQQCRERKLNDNMKRVEEGIRLFSKEIVFVPEECQSLVNIVSPSNKHSNVKLDPYAQQNTEFRGDDGYRHDDDRVARRSVSPLKSVAEYSPLRSDYQEAIPTSTPLSSDRPYYMHSDLPHTRSRHDAHNAVTRDAPTSRPYPDATNNRSIQDSKGMQPRDRGAADLPRGPSYKGAEKKKIRTPWATELDTTLICEKNQGKKRYSQSSPSRCTWMDDGSDLASAHSNSPARICSREPNYTTPSPNRRRDGRKPGRFEWEERIDDAENIDVIQVARKDCGNLKDCTAQAIMDQQKRKEIGMEGRRIGNPPGGRSSLTLD